MVVCSIPKSAIDQATADLLQNGGVATLNLPLQLAQIHSSAFQTATRALNIAADIAKYDGNSYPHSEFSQVKLPIIEPKANSGSVTGYHSAGGDNALSRYNVHREGFVFSNGESFELPLPTSSANIEGAYENSSFEQEMNDMFNSLCNVIAKDILRGIERYLKIDEGWFEDVYGPMNLSSQWHVKRYVEPRQVQECQGENIIGHDVGEKDTKEEEGIEWLPVHTDPSLISIIIHDVPGTNPLAMGLEYQSPGERSKRVWKEVESHGHAVATVFCGSVMSYITGGLFQSAKHRVIYRPVIDTLDRGPKGAVRNPRYRQAATLFLRPQGKSVLKVPPSEALGDRDVKIRKNCKFQDWLNRVSRNYQGGNKNNDSKSKSKIREEKKKKESVNDITNSGAGNDVDTDPMYWADEYTELTLHGSHPELNGKEKYLGGELCELDNHIYTIPGFARRILDMDVSVEPPKLKLMGPELPGDFKWLRGIPIGEYIYGIPCHSDAVLKINALTKSVELLQWDESVPGACPRNQKWKYHGAAVSKLDGCIYCIPQAAERVLKIDPATDNMTFIGPKFPGVNKWYGGLILEDGCIYGICQNARGILRIDPKTQDCTIHGDFPEGHYKWHGAVKHTDGNLYCIPAHADKVLKVQPGDLEPRLSLLGENIRTGAHRTDGKYKFLGGAVGGDCVYFFPSDADYVCEVNTKTGGVREVGPNLRDLEPMRNNKWQNGFTANDGTIYGIPLKGQTVLRIRLNLGAEPDITTIGGPYMGLNKWEGGVNAANGDMYCMPLNHKFSLRIRPLKNDANETKGRTRLVEEEIKYKFGDATLRSSVHTVSYSKSRSSDKGPNTGNHKLPPDVRTKQIISYDASKYDLRKEVVRMLLSLDPETIGQFQDDSLILEKFTVPPNSLLPRKKSKSKTGNGELAQNTLTDSVLKDEQFHSVFDRFICEEILPGFQKKLIACDAIPSNEPTTFYYQRPPTLRIQPGPSTRAVRAHSDATYGHQDGELNFWMPLTDPDMTLTDLWSESRPGAEDYAPLGPKLGELVSFHGTSCKHYVPANASNFTRISLDFRIGVAPYFDANWTMLGTKSDHTRRKVILQAEK